MYVVKFLDGWFFSTTKSGVYNGVVANARDAAKFNSRQEAIDTMIKNEFYSEYRVVKLANEPTGV